MAKWHGQAPFLASETLAGVAAVWLLLATFLSYIYDLIPKNPDGLTGVPLTLVFLVMGAAPMIGVKDYRATWRDKQTLLNRNVDEVVTGSQPFTLYLRPFVTSGRIKVPNDWPHFGQRMLLGDPWDLELALATVIGPDTPLVAIGHTRHGVGAAKLTSSDADWRGHMQRLAQRARLILAVPLDRPSTLWEIEEIKANEALLEKSVFVMPPSSRFYDFLFFLFRRSIAARWRTSARQLKAKGIALPRYRHRGGMFLIGQDGKPSTLAGFRNFRPAYIDGMLDDLSANAAPPADRIAAFNRTYGGTRWLRPRMFGGLSLLGIYTPNGIKRITLFVVVWSLFSTFLFHMRSIPSEHMLPALQVGDRVAVTNFAYGYNRSSLPFGIGLIFIPDDPANPDEHILGRTPQRGDVAIFQHTHSDRVMIDRVVGLPGDAIQMKHGRLYLNDKEVPRAKERRVTYVPDDGSRLVTATEYRQTIPTGEKDIAGKDILRTFLIHEFSDQDSLDETPRFVVPPGHFFAMGDNRDNAEDSRAPSGHRRLAATSPEAWPFRGVSLSPDPRDDAIGHVPLDHLIGRAETVLFTHSGCPANLPPEAECLPSRVWQGL